LHEPRQLENGRVVLEQMPHHQDPVGRLCHLDHLQRVVIVQREGLLYKGILASLHRSYRERSVGGGVSTDGYGVHGLVGQYILETRVETDAGDRKSTHLNSSHVKSSYSGY